MERVAGFLINDEGPMLIDLVTRPSTTAPNRIKVAFAVNLTAGSRVVGPNGEEMSLPTELLGQTAKLGSEFRLEMN